MQENVKVEVVEEVSEFLSVPVAEVKQGTVVCDFSKFKSQIMARVEQCKEMVLTEDNYKELANVKAGINKSITLVKQYTTSLKKEVLKPFEAYEKEAKECIALMESASKAIQVQIEEADEKLAEEKKKGIIEWFAKFCKENNITFVKIEQIWNPKWLNKTYKSKDVVKDINASLDSINSAISILETLEGSDILVADFMRKLTFEGLQGNKLVNEIVFEYNARKQKQKELQEQRQRQQEEVKEEVVKEHPAPVVEEQPKVEEQKTAVQTYNFNLVVTEATQEQVTALAKFLKENGYKFKLVQ